MARPLALAPSARVQKSYFIRSHERADESACCWLVLLAASTRPAGSARGIAGVSSQARQAPVSWLCCCSKHRSIVAASLVPAGRLRPLLLQQASQHHRPHLMLGDIAGWEQLPACAWLDSQVHKQGQLVSEIGSSTAGLLPSLEA
jgi:hypothetical protein